MTLTPAQVRAGRALLDWTRKELSAEAGISPETIKNIERGTFNPMADTLRKIIAAFAAKGVEFGSLETHGRFGVGAMLTARKEAQPPKEESDAA
jgi:DNA-binding XRE family transcriptional regulator